MVDLDLEADTLGEACATKNPLACYISLQMCQTGNVAEEFLERGVSQLNIVMSSSHYDHVLECLCHIVPLFVHRQELLIQSSSFLKLLQEILAIDSTFLKMAKNLVISDFPGPVLKEFSNMLAYQSSQCSRYGLHSPVPIIELWLKILTEIQGWPSHRGVLYLLQHCITECINSSSSEVFSPEIRHVFKELDTKLLDTNHQGFFSWLSGSKSATSFYNSTMAEFPWVALLVLECEEERQESQLFWNCLVEELSKSPNPTLDQCHKQIISDYPDWASNLNGLPIYQWCNCILDGESNHPLQAVFVQKFFKYFTSQFNSTSPRVGRYFFEGVINAHYFGKLVTKLKCIEDIHKSKEEEDEVLQLSKMFKAFGLWLEDMRVLDETLHLASLPPMMMPDLLASVFSPTKQIPFDDLDLSEFQNTTCAANEWKRLHFRLAKSSQVSSSQALATKRVPPSERILSYDSPRPLPSPPAWQLGRIDLADTWFVDESSFFSAVKPQINTLLSYTKEFDDHRREYSSLLHQIMDLISGLYINEDSELWTKGSCLGSNGPKGQKFECAGSAAICHKFCEAKLQKQIGNVQLFSFNFDEIFFSVENSIILQSIQSHFGIDLFL